MEGAAIIRQKYIIINKNSVYIEKSVKVGKNVIIYGNTTLEGVCEIADNVTIYPNSYISNSIIGKGSKIYTSVIENSNLGKCVLIAPFCQIKNSEIADGCKISSHNQIMGRKINKNLKK